MAVTCADLYDLHIYIKHIIYACWEIVILLLLLLKKVSSARLGESDIHPISPKTPAPQQKEREKTERREDRKKRKGKRVEDYSKDRAA